MKAFVLLFCAIALASASFTPHWYDCGNSSATNVFTPTNVTVQKDPKNETKTLISYCGTVNSRGAATIFGALKIYETWGPIDPAMITMRRLFKVAPDGSDICLSYSEKQDRDASIEMTAYNVLVDQVACVNMTLNWTDEKPKKFLSKRSELIF